MLPVVPAQSHLSALLRLPPQRRALCSPHATDTPPCLILRSHCPTGPTSSSKQEVNKGMGSRVLFMFFVSLVMGNRSLALDDAAVEKTLNEKTLSHTTRGSPQLCQLCEQFATEALFYLKENETQIEIIDTLHQACLKFQSLKLECTQLVDYYAALFFTKIASLSPEEFCVSASLCEEVTFIRLPIHEHACTLCHHVLNEVLTGLEDPEMELKITEILLKGCNNADNFVQKCKRLIIENAPVILEYIKKFLKWKDFCNSIHVCGSKAVHTRGDFLRALSTA